MVYIRFFTPIAVSELVRNFAWSDDYGGEGHIVTNYGFNRVSGGNTNNKYSTVVTGNWHAMYSTAGGSSNPTYLDERTGIPIKGRIDDIPLDHDYNDATQGLAR